MAYFPPTGGVAGLLVSTFGIGNQADVLDAGLPQVVHGRHDGAIRCVGVAFDEHDAFSLLLEGGLDAIGHLAARDLDCS